MSSVSPKTPRFDRCRSAKVKAGYILGGLSAKQSVVVLPHRFSRGRQAFLFFDVVDV